MVQGLEDLAPEGLLDRARRAAALMDDVARVRIFCHYDPDGTTSATILVRALMRRGKRIHATMAHALDRTSAARLRDESNELLIVSDMGSGQLDLLEGLPYPVIVLDHHKPMRDSETVAHVNPHLFGVDGAREMCGATTTWLFALALDERNWDLAGVAMAGAIGDMQHLGGFAGMNAALFEEALARKVLSRERGLALVSAPVGEALARCIVPYFVGVSGRPEGGRRFLEELKIDPQVPLAELVPEERRRLTSALALQLLKQGADAEAVEALVKERYWATPDDVFADDLSAYVDGCARLGYEGLGLSLCLGDKEAFARAEAIRKEFDDRLFAYLHKLEAEGPFAKKHIQFFYTDEASLAGSVAQIGMNYFLDPLKPTLGLSVMDRSTKVSARATKPLVARGLDLAVALREAAREVGGEGGGHNIASGATVPKGKEEKFLTLVDETVGRQLAPKPEA